jgi:hypothetical protein
MRKLLWLTVLAGILVSNVNAAAIQLQVTNLGLNSYRYNYTLSGFALQANQELDIRFDPAIYTGLSNGVAPSDYDLLVLQPNNPPGTAGDYRAFALVNNPSLAGPFSVDVTLQNGASPDSQPFFVNQYSQAGLLLSSTAGGFTTSVSTVPEPATLSLGFLALIIGGAARALRRRSRPA